MRLRILIAGILGGLALFVWGAISHTVIGLGDAGLQAAPQAPGDQALLDTLHGTLPANGMYFFPGMDMAKKGDAAAMAEWQKRTQTSPHGLIVLTNEPYTGMGGQLGRECVIDIGVALIAAMLLACALGCCANFGFRVGFVTLLGLLTAYRPVQLWNWYSFPSNYTGAQVLDGVLGFVVMGLVVAMIVKPTGTTQRS